MVALYPIDQTSDNGGTGERQLSRFVGRAAQTHITATTASGTSIQETASSGGTPIVYLSEVFQPQALSGNLTGTLRGLESATSVNAGLGGLLEVVDATNSSVLATLKSETGFPASITELSTTDAAKTLSSTAISGYTPAVPWRFRWTTKIKNVGTMGNGTVTTSMGQPSSNAVITPPGTPGVCQWSDRPYVSAVGTAVVAESNTTITPGIPAGVSTGDLLEVDIIVFWNGTTGTPDWATQINAADFTDGMSTAPTPVLVPVITVGSSRIAAFRGYRYATGSEGSTFNVSANSLSGNAVAALMAQVRLVKNAVTSGNPYDSLHTATGTAQTATMAGYTPGAGKTLTTGWACMWQDGGERASQGNGRMMFNYGQVNSPSGFGIYQFLSTYFNQDTAVAAPSGTWTSGPSNSGLIVVEGTILPASATQTGAATLVGVGTLTVTGNKEIPATIGMAGVGTVAVTGRVQESAAATLAGVGGMSVTPAQQIPDAATLTGVGVLSVTPAQEIPTTAAFAGVGALMVTPAQQIPSTVTISGAGQLLLSGEQQEITAAATLAGQATLTVAGEVDVPSAAALAGVGAVLISAELSIPSAAAIVGVGALIVVPGGDVSDTATLTGAGTLTVSGEQTISGTAAFVGVGELLVAGEQEIPAAAALAGVGVLDVSPGGDVSAAATVAGHGTLLVTGEQQHPATATLAGNGEMTVSGASEIPAAAALSGTGTVTVSPAVQVPSGAQISGVGVLSVTATVQHAATATIAGQGALQVNAEVRPVAAVTLAGTGTLTTTATVVEHPAAVTLAGIGAVTVDGQQTITATISIDGIGALLVVGQVVEPYRNITVAVTTGNTPWATTTRGSMLAVTTGNRAWAVTTEERS